MFIFAASFGEMDDMHQGERLSFDPSENLENSKYKGEKSESCFPAVAYIQLTPLWSQFTYIPAGVS